MDIKNIRDASVQRNFEKPNSQAFLGSGEINRVNIPAIINSTAERTDKYGILLFLLDFTSFTKILGTSSCENNPNCFH